MAPPRPQRDGQAPGQDAGPGSGRVVFLCHNSQDKAEVRTIADQLDQCGLRPWLDEREMPPGTEWLSELEEQLARTDAGVVFLGPHGLGPWQRQEIPLLLHQSNRRRIPVFAAILASTGPDVEVPGFLANRTLVDLRKAEPDPIEQLIWGITGQRPGTESPPAGPGRLWNIPSRPPHFLPRPDKLETLRSLLLATRGGTVAITGVVRVGLFGMGGIGKSVLAAWLAEDDQVRRTFVHGIYWLPLGQDPNLPVLQATLADALGEPPSRYASETPAGRLARALANKACLVILDDAWQVSHFPDNEALRLARGALHRSAQAVAGDPAQLAGQLAGRLLGRSEPDIQTLLGQAARDTSSPWLRPLNRCLNPPESPLICTLEGHRGPVTCVVVSSDGGVAVSGSMDGTVRAWDLLAGACLWTLEGHAEAVSAVALSPDGRLAVSGSEDRTVRAWDLKTGQCVRVLQGHAGVVGSLAVSRDGHLAVSTSPDGTVRIWDLQTGACLRTQEQRRWRANCVALSTDGEMAVSVSDEGTVRVWGVESGARRGTIIGFPCDVKSVAVSADGRFAVSGSVFGTVRIWDVRTGACLRTLAGHSDAALSVALSADGRLAVSASTDRTVRVWDLQTGRCVGSLEGHADRVISVAVTADGGYVVSGSVDRTARVWDLQTEAHLLTLGGHTAPVSSVAVAADGRLAVSGSKDRTVRVWDLHSARTITTFTGDAPFSACAATPDGRAVVAGNESGQVYFLRLENAG